MSRVVIEARRGSPPAECILSTHVDSQHPCPVDKFGLSFGGSAVALCWTDALGDGRKLFPWAEFITTPWDAQRLAVVHHAHCMSFGRRGVQLECYISCIWGPFSVGDFE